MKALAGAFNQQKVLAGAFSVIAKTGCGTDGALLSTSGDPGDGVQQLSDGFDPEISCRYIIYRDKSREHKTIVNSHCVIDLTMILYSMALNRNCFILGNIFISFYKMFLY